MHNSTQAYLALSANKENPNFHTSTTDNLLNANKVDRGVEFNPSASVEMVVADINDSSTWSLV